jgi:hypothetical protein
MVEQIIGESMPAQKTASRVQNGGTIPQSERPESALGAARCPTIAV